MNSVPGETAEDGAGPNPVSENRSGLIGKGVDRYEGPLKISGVAPFAYEVECPSPPVYGVIISASIAKGRIVAADTSAALAAAGVWLVWTHVNAPVQGSDPDDKRNIMLSHKPVLLSDRVTGFGEPVGFVVADTLEQAEAAAFLVDFTYEAEPAEVVLESSLEAGAPPPGQPDVAHGDFETAFAAAPVRIDAVWRTPMQNHAPMEPHATTCWWEGDVCVMHTSAQTLQRTQGVVANTIQVPDEKVRVYARYVGGGFGSKVLPSWDQILGALAARELARPVKIAMSRQQVFYLTTHRAATHQKVRLGAAPDGRLTALSMIGWAHCERGGDFAEPAANVGRSLYAAPHRLIGHRLVPLDLPAPGWMRAPGEAPGLLALECAMDEMAEKLGMDPIAFRILNEPDRDPDSGRPFSIRQLVRCMREGAQTFGWDRRNPTPGLTRDGRWLVGMGMAAAMRSHLILPAMAGLGVDGLGTVTLRQSMTDIGTGSFTILGQIAAETMGVPLDRVRVEIGDSHLPPAPGSGGQFGAATAGSAVLVAGMNLRRMLAKLAAEDPASPLYGGPEDQAQFQDGMIVIGNRAESLAALVSRAAPGGVYAEGEHNPAAEGAQWSRHTYGAHFAEVGVDPVTGEVRVRRMLGVFAAGRILNAKLARSQLTGAMIWGIGSALTEGNVVEPRYGSFINQDLSTYLTPTQADVGDLEAVMLDEVDDKASPLGAKGVGELGISGSGAAVANAVYNACGARVRDYPITPDKVIAELVRAGR